MFALRAFAPHGRQLAARIPRQATALQQRRGMAGGEDEDDSMFVNWWDNPADPDSWHKHQLAWWGVAFWGAIFYVTLGRGGKKTEQPAPDAAH